MKKFFKIVLFTILTLCLINISNTKINYLNNNNDIEKIKSPRKNAYVDMSKINNITDLSFTEWHQSGNLGTKREHINNIYSLSNSQIKVCDVINYSNRNEIKEIYTTIPPRNADRDNLANFGFIWQGSNSNNPSFCCFQACRKGSNSLVNFNFFNNNIIKFYDMSSFINAVNTSYEVNLFLKTLKSAFTLYEPDKPEEAYIQVNDNITTNREELDKNFKHIYINGLSQTFSLNEKIDISPLLTNQNINELEISLVYNDLPTIIYNQVL